MVFSDTDVLKLFQSISQLRILVIGDVMLDEFHWCDVQRISPEAPVPVCSVKKTTLCPGGAANVAANIAALDATVDLCGFIGRDSTADRFLALLKEHHIGITGLVETSKSTTLKSRIIADQQHVVRVDRESQLTYNASDRKALYRYIESRITQYQAIVLSDYLKGVLEPRFTQKIISLAKKHQCLVIVDPKGSSYRKYKNANYLTPNYKEFCDVTKKTHTSESSIKKHGLSLAKSLNLEALIITRSERGMSIISDNNMIDMPTEAQEVYDITGAGDTVIACLALGLGIGLSIEHAAKIANCAAGIVVSKIGTAFVSIEELKESIETRQ